MDREEVLSLITDEDVIEIMKDLGSNDYKITSDAYIFQSVCHGSNSYKLYYYLDSGIFKCYSCCGIMSLYDVIMSTWGMEFKEAFKYVCDFKGVDVGRQHKVGLQKKQEINTDLDFLKIHLYKKTRVVVNLPSYDKNILNIFDDYMPSSWCNEGISPEVAKIFGVGMYFSQKKAIIPHFDTNGSLVGIRARSFNEWEVKSGKKYMPITIQGLNYRYPINFNLYGLYQNKEAIKKFKKVIIFESEKSVMIYGSMYGQENNIAVATCGTTLSLYQRDLLLALGVEEVVIAYDKQYLIDLIDDKSNTKEYKEYESYIKTLIKMTNIFINYSKVSIMCCWDTALDYKDSPIDKGQEIFEQLYKERYLVSDVEELKEMIA